MKKFNYRFRSIMVNNVEKIVPGTRYKTMVIEMDEKTIEEHSIELTVNDIIHDKSWIINFMLAVNGRWRNISNDIRNCISQLR